MCCGIDETCSRSLVTSDTPASGGGEGGGIYCQDRDRGKTDSLSKAEAEEVEEEEEDFLDNAKTQSPDPLPVGLRRHLSLFHKLFEPSHGETTAAFS